MTSNVATALVYGVCVPLPDLLAAGQAFGIAQPTLLTVGMIRSRRDNRRLLAGETLDSAVGRVPIEVWDLIRKYVIGSCVADARRALHERVRQRCSGRRRSPRRRRGRAANSEAADLFAVEWLVHEGDLDDEDAYEDLSDALCDLDDELWSTVSRS